MAPTLQARRIQKARSIIRYAYRLASGETPAPVRYELIGDNVAVAVVRIVSETSEAVSLWVARRLASGRICRVRADSRDALQCHRQVMAHFEFLYSKYGAAELQAQTTLYSPTATPSANR